MLQKFQFKKETYINNINLIINKEIWEVIKVKIKIIIFIVTMLFFSLSFTSNVLAGSEEDPEIEDEPNENVMEYLDIISAWFYEEENQPDYLFVALKLKEINPYHLKQHLVVQWEYNEEFCAAGLHIGYGQPWFYYSAGYGHGWWFQEFYEQIEGEYDSENGIILCKIPKEIINNPQMGDTLTKTKASTFQRYGFIGRLGFSRFWIASLISLATNKTPWDGAPYEYGRDYIIQY